MESFGTTSNPFHGISRDQRRRLTTSLLGQALRAEGDERSELLDQVVLVNMCVAQTIAARYRSRGIAQEDLEQVANAALVRAVQNFDGTRECDLLSYAVPSIRGELRRYFRDHGWMVRPPRKIQDLQARVIEERDRRLREHGSTTEADIAEALGVPEADVVEALTAQGCFTPTSLDIGVGEGGTTSLGELLPDPESGEVESAEARVMLRPVIRGLSARDRKLLKMRFFQELTQQEMADEIGVTQTQVSRLLSRVLSDLRRGLGEMSLPAATDESAQSAQE